MLFGSVWFALWRWGHDGGFSPHGTGVVAVPQWLSVIVRATSGPVIIASLINQIWAVAVFMVGLMSFAGIFATPDDARAAQYMAWVGGAIAVALVWGFLAVSGLLRR